MDQHLFSRHVRSIKERQSIKQTIIQEILEKTGVTLEEEEITILKKTVTISTSSVKRAALSRKKVGEVVSGLGFTLSF